MSREVTSFVNALLETEPGPARSISLYIDTDGDAAALFEVLLLIMTDILKRWYTPPISIRRMSEADAARLVGYFASFGYHFNLAVAAAPRVLRINNRDYVQHSRLEDMKFQMAEEGNLYTVTFTRIAQ
jgi:hypothetical protein